MPQSWNGSRLLSPCRRPVRTGFPDHDREMAAIGRSCYPHSRGGIGSTIVTSKGSYGLRTNCRVRATPAIEDICKCKKPGCASHQHLVAS